MALGKRDAIIYSLVTINNITSIDQIASTIGVTPNKAFKIIQNMINTSNTLFDFANDALLLKNAQIDHLNRKIVLDPSSANRQRTIFKNPFAQIKKSISMNNVSVSARQQRVVTCNGCGAENMVVEGLSAECAYCGASIN
ncbi:MAG: hypothetical protein FWH52_00900 [Synergistaceae bacterium]|nr:hypothetical protein [Synergistaceae bacterium]